MTEKPNMDQRSAGVQVRFRPSETMSTPTNNELTSRVFLQNGVALIFFPD